MSSKISNHSGHHHHHGHVEGAANCKGKTNIHGPSGIPSLRKHIPLGVPNRKVQEQIALCEREIKHVKSHLVQPRSKTPENLKKEAELNHKLNDLNAKLADLRSREFHSNSPSKNTKPEITPPLDRTPSPASVTSSDNNSSSLPESSKTVSSSDREDSVRLYDSDEESLFGLNPSSTRSIKPYDTDAESLFEAESELPVVSVQKAEISESEYQALKRTCFETVDKVRQAYAIVTTHIGFKRDIPVFIDPKDPLQGKFGDLSNVMSNQIRDGKAAIEEHVLPRIESDLKSQKERYITERDDQTQFIQTVIKHLPKNEESDKIKKELEKYLPEDPLLDNPSLGGEARLSYLERPKYPQPALVENEKILLEERLGKLSPSELRQTIQKHQNFLNLLNLKPIPTNIDDPYVSMLVEYTHEIGIEPKGYCQQYTELLKEVGRRNYYDSELQDYMSDVRSATASYRGLRENLKIEKPALCKFVENRVLPLCHYNRKSIETAMNDFYPETK